MIDVHINFQFIIYSQYRAAIMNESVSFSKKYNICNSKDTVGIVGIDFNCK